MAIEQHYQQIVLYASGHILAILIGAGLWLLWGLLGGFAAEPVIWAWLSSIAVRDIKHAIVRSATAELRSRWGRTQWNRAQWLCTHTGRKAKTASEGPSERSPVGSGFQVGQTESGRVGWPVSSQICTPKPKAACHARAAGRSCSLSCACCCYRCPSRTPSSTRSG